MAEMRILVAFVLSFVCAKCAMISGKDFFCRDPDTGKLHAVNTSWASSSFCGNYTCALRKRNDTLATQIPIRKFTGNIFNNKNNNKSEIVMTEITIHPDNQVLATEIEPEIVIQGAVNDQVSKIEIKSETITQGAPVKTEPISSNATQNTQLNYPTTSIIQSNDMNVSQKTDITNDSLNVLKYDEDKVNNVNNKHKPNFVKNEDINTNSDKLTSAKNYELERSPASKNLQKPKLVKDDKNTNSDKLTSAKHHELEKSPASKKVQKIYDSDKNRYLTDEEINNITYLLRTVKRSDLDALLEVYSLAQEIYEEMDKRTDKELIDEAVNILEVKSKHHPHPHKTDSYWYDHMLNKGKMADRFNMDHQDTKIHTTVSKPTSPDIERHQTVSTNYIDTVSTNYPLSEFQRRDSYRHPMYQTNKETAAKYVHKEICNKHQHATRKSQKLIQTSRLLPYPYTNMNRYNISDYYRTKFYYDTNPWALDYLNRYYYKPYYSAPYSSPVDFQKAVLLNPHLSDLYVTEQVVDKRGDVTRNVLRKADTPEWKTDSLSIDVLKDIRANIDTSRLIKAFPWRKKMTLEKVGSVNRMDELERNLKRFRRSVDGNSVAETFYDEYEPYLVKVMCEPQTEPGYFRIGNMSQPYPNCCPQLLNTTR